ncbi:alpha/beta-hydrolase [Lyophyllum atratum]|nr:alpha/beta-hydrolase [Lyophyllum atratum]
MRPPTAALVSALFSILLVQTVFSTPVGETVELEKRTISSAVYDDLVFYFKYAASTHFNICPRPNGNTFILRLDDKPTDTQGFIARDDTRKEIVLSLRAATSIQDFIIDADIRLTKISSPGVSAPAGVAVHSGFLRAWNSIAAIVISTVRQELASHPGYTIVTTGHSLGGALSSLAGITLKQNFPNVPIRMYTYGQPRTGNSAYATWVNQQFGPGKHFRAVHTTDPVPHIPPRFGLGDYAHHGVEYWTYFDSFKTSLFNIPLIFTVVTPAHLTYFNIPAAFPFCS